MVGQKQASQMIPLVWWAWRLLLIFATSGIYNSWKHVLIQTITALNNSDTVTGGSIFRWHQATHTVVCHTGPIVSSVHQLHLHDREQEDTRSMSTPCRSALGPMTMRRLLFKHLCVHTWFILLLFMFLWNINIWMVRKHLYIIYKVTSRVSLWCDGRQ